MPRVTSQKTRQYLLVPGETVDPAELPEKMELYDASGNPINLSGAGLPSGGAPGQVLTKQSPDDYIADWDNLPDGLPGGGDAGEVLTKLSGADGDAFWLPGSGGVNIQGEWSSATAYSAGDIVTDRTGLYQALEDVAAGGTRPMYEGALSETTFHPGGAAPAGTPHRIQPFLDPLVGEGPNRTGGVQLYFFELATGGTVTINDLNNNGDYLKLFSDAGVLIASNYPTLAFGSPLVVTGLAAGKYFVFDQDAFLTEPYYSRPTVRLTAGATFNKGTFKWRCLAKPKLSVAEAISLLTPNSWWRLNEAVSTNQPFYDSGSAGFNGTPVLPNYRGVAGGVDGSDDYTESPGAGGGFALGTFGDHYNFTGNLPFTILVFHRPFVSGWGTNFRRLLMKNDSTAGPFMGLTTDGRYGFTRAGAGGVTVLSARRATELTWNMLVARYDGTTLEFFHNGKKASQEQAGAIPASSQSLRLNGEPGNAASWGANGGYQHLAIWESVLSDAALRMIRNAFLERR